MGGGGCCDICCVMNCCIGDFFSCSDSGCCVGNCSDSGCCVSDGSGGGGYDNHADVIANELATMKERARKYAQKQEAEILQDIDDSMKDFLDWLEKINSQKIGGRTLSINVERLQRLNRDMHDDVEGFIGRRLDERLVPTDSEVSSILAERDDKKRKKNFDAFYDRIKRDAVRALIKEIETSVDKQNDSIEREIQNRMDEVQSSMNTELEALQDLQMAQKAEASEVATKQVEYLYRENLTFIMSAELKKAEAN